MQRQVIRLADATRPLEVVVVRYPACHLCEEAIEALTGMSQTHPLEIRVVEIDSDEGRSMVAEHRPTLSPAVVIDGRLFSSGRLPRKKLQRMLNEKGSK